MLILTIATTSTWIALGMFGALRRIAVAIEAQNRHYGIGTPDESGITGAEDGS